MAAIPKHFARGRITRRVPGQMSGLEKKYAEHLQALQDTKQIVAWRYESVKLRLADKTFYTPDFYVLNFDGSIDLLEVKGSWAAPNQDKSRVKLKVAADQFPEFRFSAITARAKKNGGGWDTEEF